MQCEAKSKQSGNRCKRRAAVGRNVCAMHGGKTPRGLALPQTTHGRYSKDLPAGLLAGSYAQERENDDPLQLREELALIRARARELLHSLEAQESGALWRRVKASFQEFTDAVRRDDQTRMSAALAELRVLIEQGWQPYQVWAEVNAQLNLAIKAARAGHSREARLAENLTAQQAAVLMSVIQFELREAVRAECDEETARRVLGRFSEGVRRARGAASADRPLSGFAR